MSTIREDLTSYQRDGDEADALAEKAEDQRGGGDQGAAQTTALLAVRKQLQVLTGLLEEYLPLIADAVHDNTRAIEEAAETVQSEISPE